jgi:hypothetical protein
MSNYTLYYDEVLSSFTSNNLVPVIHSKRQDILNKVKNTTKDYSSKLYKFVQKPETKIASLMSYWAVETVFSVAAIYAFVTLGMYGSAVAMLLLLAYLSYATFGVIGEVTK